MRRKGMGKRIAAIVLAVTMSISMAGFQTGIVKAEESVGETPVAETTVVVEEAPAVETTGDVSISDEATGDEIASDVTTDEETTGDETIGDATNDNKTIGEDATGDVADEETTDEETTGDVSEEDELTDEEKLTDEELTPEELAAKQAAEEEARLAAEEEARLAAEKEAARIRAELLATSPEIIAQQTNGNVTVYVDAPEGAFPGGTSVVITPVYQTYELVDAIDSVETTEDIVAFDITFYDIDGYEIQPRDGYTVNVSFELAAASELARDDATLQVFHVDDEQNATPVGDEIPSSSEGVEVSVEAESFSVYAITVVQDPVEVKDEYYLTVGQTMEITKSLGHLKTEDIQVSSDSNVEIVSKEIVEKFGNDHAQINIKAISAGDATVTVNFRYKSLFTWKDGSVSFKVHVADPQEFNLGEDLTEKSQEVNIVLGGFSLDDNRVENWFREIFGKDPKEAIAVSYDNGEVVTAEVIGITNGYSIFDAKWAEKAAVATVKLTPKENAAGKSDTVYLTYDVVGIGGGKQTVSFEVTVGAKHTVTFDYGYENKVDTQSVEHDSMVEKPADPTREGYKFLGWYVGEDAYDFSTLVTGDLTLTAKWGKNYNAEFYLLKNVNVIPLETGSTQYPAKNYTAKDLENMVGVVTDVKHVEYDDQTDVTGLNIAKAFQPVQEVITEKPDAGYLETIKNDILAAQGYTENLENYDILWYVVKKAGGTYHVDGVVYDKTANYKKLTYDANTTDSVTGLPVSEAHPLGSEVSVADQTPSRSGYTFTGWKDENGKAYKAGDVLTLNENTTLYAQWKKNTKTAVNFYIQLDSVVMDGEDDITRRDVKYFSGSVANSTMNEAVDTTFAYAGDKDNAAVANSKIREDYLGNEDFVKDCPADGDVFANLQKDGKTLKKFGELNKDISTLTADNYDIYWYVVKYDTADGWHVDGILQEKDQNPDGDKPVEEIPGGNPGSGNPGGDNPGGGNPGGGNPSGGNPGGSNPGGGSTPGDPGTTVIPDDDTPLAPKPSDDTDVEPTEIDDEEVPLSDETELDDEDVPLADLPDDEAEVTTIDDEDIPLSDNPLTGDSASVLWAVMAALAAFGLTAVAVTGKRKREE
ncbi:MAG: doubled motif LPXTG anchor domain-containing protein [Lachnospiraceae bacterium]